VCDSRVPTCKLLLLCLQSLLYMHCLPPDSTASTANPHVLLAGSVSRFHCSRCWEAYLPWLCSHKHHTALAALCVCDTRLPGYGECPVYTACVCVRSTCLPGYCEECPGPVPSFQRIAHGLCSVAPPTHMLPKNSSDQLSSCPEPPCSAAVLALSHAGSKHACSVDLHFNV